MLKIISVTYNHIHELEVSIGSFLLQTNSDWDLTVVHDGNAPSEVREIMERYKSDSRIHFVYTSIRNGKYGHPNRKTALESLTGNNNDFVLLTNSDNYVVPKFVEIVMSATKVENVGIVMYDCIHSHLNYGYHRSRLFEGGIDMAAFVVRLDIAKKVGFVHDHFSADGAYASECGVECASRGMVAMHIEKGLVIHN